MAKRTKRLLAATLATAVASAVTVAAASTRPAAQAAQGPIKIGISLSLSGDFSDPGKAVKRGYDLWAAYVNAHGGILGRKVQLKIVDDASNPTQVVTNYQNLITRDKVDLTFGPFSSLLTGPAATSDLTPIIGKAIAPKPDMIIGGTQSVDAYNQVKALVQAKYSPKFLFFSNGANSPTEFPSKVGAKNVNGIFSCSDWTPTEPSSGNKLFVSQYVKRYGGNQFQIDNNSSEAWAVGQLLQLAVKKVGSIDNQKIIAALHKGTWPTIEGNLSWDKDGAPNGNDLLVEWVGGKLLPVFPKSFALAKPFSPKPAWGK